MATALARDPTPKVNARYGAPLGRASGNLTGFEVDPGDQRFYLRRIHIDHQGYDPGGAYWGIGTPLYWWSVTITEGGSTDTFEGFFRAAGRAHAKQKILNIHPHARFF